MSKSNRIKSSGGRRVRAGYPASKNNARIFGPIAIDMPYSDEKRRIRFPSKTRRSDGAPLYREPFTNTRQNPNYIESKRHRLERKGAA